MKWGVLIVGGGVIGLSVGWLLARSLRERGLRTSGSNAGNTRASKDSRVLIIERGEVGQESSWAAAGMLSPTCELAVGGEALYGIGQASLALYPGFVRELEQISGMQVGFRTEGTLQLALDADELQQLARLFKRQQACSASVEWLSGEEAQALEPGLSHRVVAGISASEDYQVDNRRLVRALKLAFLASGGELREHCEVQELVPLANEAPAVQVAGEVLRGKQVLLAAGCWSGIIKGVNSLVELPVRPVKGQALYLRAPKHEAPQRILRGVGVYLLAREDGRLLVGASVEEQGFNKQTTAGAIFSLLREARRLYPRVDQWQLEDVWAGLRPASRDNAPLLGQVSAGFFVATGHYRSGILNAPITAKCMVNLMLANQNPTWLKQFAPARLATSVDQHI